MQNYDWINFYTEFADILLKYKNNRTELVEKIKDIYTVTGLKMPKLELDRKLIDIDPFSVYGLFNKGITDANRIKILKAIADIFGVNSNIPSSFNGIPVVNNMHATFYSFIDNRGESDIDNIWELCESAIQYSKEQTTESKNAVIKYYDIVRSQSGISWNITMGLYWIRPYTFINLDSCNRNFITSKDNVPQNFADVFSNIKKGIPDGEKYLFMCEQAKNILNNGDFEYKNFAQLSYQSWCSAHNTKNNSIQNEDKNEIGYWIFSPGCQACMWDEFTKLGIMGINWDKLNLDLKEFKSKEDIKAELKSVYDPQYSYKNDALCLWQFANDMKPGDIVFAKKGAHTIIGKGLVTSEYVFDESRDTYKHIRKIDWQEIGEWEYPKQTVLKTLTNITAYSDDVKTLLELVRSDENEVEPEDREVIYPLYNKDDFLEEVYMSENDYDILVSLVENKYNVILEGAPGVGKTYVAKRLAYSIMGERDISRVSMVQFHQSYSYEDFMQGYRPTENGFKLESGLFYDFCKKAEEDDERLYFFIIDEINRGNLSKIFGELMMLIEKDKRGQKIKLLYNNEWFVVPDNIRIIGMMNTADRSLAMMDYALRRRFAFYEMSPAFDNEGFNSYIESKDNDKLLSLINVIKELNTYISNDDTLGSGFEIGHSYFCTDSDIDDKWLKSVVEYEIIPLLKEYWFDEPTKVKDWSARLRSTLK